MSEHVHHVLTEAGDRLQKEGGAPGEDHIVLESFLEPTRGRVSWAEFETPFTATRGQVSWAELEVPFLPTRGRISWAELEIPRAKPRLLITLHTHTELTDILG